MKTKAGIVLKKDDKFLVVHPTNNNHKFYSFPKGCLDESDLSLFHCAKRELFEETNIDLSNYKLDIIPFNVITYGKSKLTLYYVDGDKYCIFTDNLKCNSYFEMYEKNFPEVDEYLWATFDQLKECLHEPQKQILTDLKQIIKVI